MNVNQAQTITDRASSTVTNEPEIHHPANNTHHTNANTSSPTKLQPSTKTLTTTKSNSNCIISNNAQTTARNSMDINQTQITTEPAIPLAETETKAILDLVNMDSQPNVETSFEEVLNAKVEEQTNRSVKLEPSMFEPSKTSTSSLELPEESGPIRDIDEQELNLSEKVPESVSRMVKEQSKVKQNVSGPTFGIASLEILEITDSTHDENDFLELGLEPIVPVNKVATEDVKIADTPEGISAMPLPIQPFASMSIEPMPIVEQLSAITTESHIEAIKQLNDIMEITSVKINNMQETPSIEFVVPINNSTATVKVDTFSWAPKEYNIQITGLPVDLYSVAIMNKGMLHDILMSKGITIHQLEISQVDSSEPNHLIVEQISDSLDKEDNREFN